MNNQAARQPVVILISGRGSNMRALIERSLDAASPYAVARVFSDQPDAGGLPIARDFGIATQTLPGSKLGDREAYDRRLAGEIGRCSPALIVLAGFMRILSAEFVNGFGGRILNIHPSLLPKYAGLHTHRRAIAAGEAEHGATVHFVTEQLDGGPRIVQARVPVGPDDDEASLALRVQGVEHRIYPLAVNWFCTGRLRYREGRAYMDGEMLREPIHYEELENPKHPAAS